MGTNDLAPLSAAEAYPLWAEHYDRETAVSSLENAAVEALTPRLAGRALLDAGCGTGRRLLHAAGAARVVGADLVPAMLLAGRRNALAGVPAVGTDFRMLPFAAAVFDVIWCRLAIGHVAEIGPVYREFARVAKPGACLIITDFHPDAARAGHQRTFRDATGRLHAIEHYIHLPSDHERAARDAGLTLEIRRDCAVGPAIRSFYERAGKLAAYEAQRGLPLVLALGFRLPSGNRLKC
ncbi:MAG TPA: class I SAM-dependent methyltransferase [Longimicrobiales bacterium]